MVVGRNLTPGDEWLLQKYHDGCCGCMGSWLARWLLRRQSARDFMKGLALTSEASKAWCSIYRRADLDLWDGVSTRIDQEKLAEFYLGERVFKKESEEQSRRLSFAWGISGVVAAAMALIVLAVFPGGTKSLIFNSAKSVDYIRENNATLAKNNAPTMRLVANKGYRRLVSGSPGEARMELDWLRSSGQVHMLRQSEHVAPVIWIKRDAAAQKVAAARVSGGYRPLGRATRIVNVVQR